MALTLVTRETFQGVGTLNSSTPGNLGTVTGNFYKRAVGPRLTSDTTASSRGWSADPQFAAAKHLMNNATMFPTLADNLVGPLDCADFWIYLDAAAANQELLRLNAGLQTILALTLNTDGLSLIYLSNANGAYVSSLAITLSVRAWINFRLVWQKQTDPVYQDRYNATLYMRASGAGSWTTLWTCTQFPFFANANSGITMGFSTTGAQARFAMPSLYTLGSLADSTALVTDVVDPPAGPFGWFANPATGNDSNDGTSAASAWQSVGKINMESANLGMFPTASGYASGDTLTIDTTASNLPLGTASLNLLTRGLNVVQLGGGRTGTGEIQAWTSIAAGSWTLVSGATKTYQHTLTESNPSCVVWENDKFLSHITGTSFGSTATYTVLPSYATTTYANVTAALEANPGSFWTDGTTLYLHPFDNTNPASDGKTYTRSYNRGATGISAVQMLAPDLHISGLRVRKTCLADNNASDPIGAYCFQSISAGGGTSLLENCYGDYGSKHIFGFTDSSTARRFIVRNCQAEQGSPYQPNGGQTPWVDYSSLSGTQDNQTLYDGCVTNKSSGNIGASTGYSPTNTNVWIEHGSGLNFSLLRWQNCTFDNSLSDQGNAAVIQLYQTTCGGGSFGSASVSVDQCKSVSKPFTSSTGSTVTVTNSLVVSAASYYAANSQNQAAGTLVYRGCTIDLSGAVSGNASSGGDAFLARSGALTLTVQNCLFISVATGANQLSFLSGATSSDTLNFDHNAYKLGSNLIVAAAYNDGSTTSNRTLVQWQTLGKDANSFATTNPMIDSSYIPQPGSALIDAGTNLGPLADYTGTVFATRNDIGAYEAVVNAMILSGFFFA